MASREATVTRDEVQGALARLLLERVRRDEYPSRTEMEILEQVLPPKLQREYLNVLFEKALSYEYPSIDLLRHIARISQRL